MYLILAIVTAISSVVSLGFAIQAYSQVKGTDNAGLTNAKYALSRSLALVIAVCGLLIVHKPSYLIALAVAMTGVQLFDGLIGLKISAFKTWGPLLTAAFNALFLIFYLMH